MIFWAYSYSATATYKLFFATTVALSPTALLPVLPQFRVWKKTTSIFNKSLAVWGLPIINLGSPFKSLHSQLWFKGLIVIRYNFLIIMETKEWEISILATKLGQFSFWILAIPDPGSQFTQFRSVGKLRMRAVESATPYQQSEGHQVQRLCH